MQTEQRYMNRSLRLLWIFALLFSALSFASCEDEMPLPDEDDLHRRTVLMYVVAENSLGADGQWKRDSTEIQEGVAALKDGHCLLAFVDDGNKPRLYRFHRDKQPSVEKLWQENLCSSDPATLRHVMQMVVSDYPANEYALVMWSHADGWLPPTNTDYSPLSFGIDVGSGGDKWKDKDSQGRIGAQMKIEEMAAAIAECGVKLRYVFFDACLMQNIEVAYALRHVTNYIIASPISIPAQGAYYRHQVAEGLFSDSPLDIARIYYEDVTSPELYKHYTDFGIVMSVVDTRHLEALAALTAELLPASALVGGVSPDMSGVMLYKPYKSSFYYRPHFFDAASAMRRLLSEADYLRFRAALDKVVCYKAATPKFWAGPMAWDFCLVEEDYAGISLFVPQTIYADNAELCRYGNLNEAFKQTEWYDAAGWATTGW